MHEPLAQLLRNFLVCLLSLKSYPSPVTTPKRALLFIGFLLAAPCIQAQETKTTTAVKHSLWKVQGKENAVFLLGSIHVLKKESYPLPFPIEAAYTNSSITVFETDID